MWLPTKAFDLFRISKDTFDHLREEVATLRTENKLLQDQLNKAEIMCDWLRMQHNTLQQEKAAFMKQTHGVSVPAPELVRRSALDIPKLDEFTFEDLGDALAKQIGLPTYDA